MASFLSEPWVQELGPTLNDLPEQQEVTGSIRFAVTSTPHGKVQFRLMIVDGQVKEVIPGREGEADVIATFKYPDAVAWFQGQLDTDYAYMMGLVKFEGDYSAFVYRLRPVWASEAWAQALAGLAQNTQFED
ncbi:MAG: SCP2 sterol-binding domain-containing protein [Acidimicrobiales bacterium]|jgi:hypothetical protein